MLDRSVAETRVHLISSTREGRTPRARPLDKATLATLSAHQAVALVPLIGHEAGRIVLRNLVLRHLRRLLYVDGGAPTRPAAHDARQIADDLQQPARPGAYGDLLQAVRDLSRAGCAPGPKQVERALLSGGGT